MSDGLKDAELNELLSALEMRRDSQMIPYETFVDKLLAFNASQQ